MSDIEFINNTPKSLGDHMIKLGLRSISSYDQIAKKRILLLRSIDRESEYLTMINPVIKDGFGEKIVVETRKGSEDLVYIPKAYGVVVLYQDLSGEYCEKIFVGEESLSIQYELD